MNISLEATKSVFTATLGKYEAAMLYPNHGTLNSHCHAKGFFCNKAERNALKEFEIGWKRFTLSFAKYK